MTKQWAKQIVVAAAAAMTMSGAVFAQPQEQEARLLRLEYETSSENSDGDTTSSSSGRQALIETFVGETPAGRVFEYDLPRDENQNKKPGFWYFPAKVRERSDGTAELLEIDVIQARIDKWLEDRDIPPEACGTWTHGGGFPFKVDCDPYSILDQIAPFQLRIPDVKADGEYTHPQGKTEGILVPLPSPRSGYAVELPLDEAKARLSEVEHSLILAQMLGLKLSRQQAESDAAKIQFEGSIVVEFDVDRGGLVSRRSETVTMVIARPNAQKEKRTASVIVAR